MARRRAQDLDALIRQAQEDAQSIGFAADAGMLDATSMPLARLQSGLNEIKRTANMNGAAAQTTAAAPTGSAPEPSMDLEAEEHVLGAMMLAPGAIKSAATEVRTEQFYLYSHQLIFDAILALDARGVEVSGITVHDHLQKSGQIDKVTGRDGGKGGKARVFEIAALVPTTANVAHYARIVRRRALERNLDSATLATPRDANLVAEAAAALTREEISGDPRRAVDGTEWLHSQQEGCPAVWGKGDTVFWAEGEPLMIYGPDGVGKTSVAQQIVLHLCGVRTDVLLGLPVAKADRPILYLACDRPRQAKRSLFRMIPRENHEELRGRLMVWEGPLPFSIPAQSRALLDWCQLHEAGYLIIDSLKDVAIQLTDPETALKVNQAFQWLNANGIELLVLHHPRKDPAGTPARAKSLEDVYGDRNFVAGMGSVVSLYGKGGDPIVDLEHLKQPAGEVGPFKILHDHDNGVTVLYDHSTIAQILVDAGRPMTVPEVACRFYGVGEAEKNQIEKTRRELRKLAGEKQAQEMKDETGALAFAAL
jgi:replicative DNA helicase